MFTLSHIIMEVEMCPKWKETHIGETMRREKPSCLTQIASIASIIWLKSLKNPQLNGLTTRIQASLVAV